MAGLAGEEARVSVPYWLCQLSVGREGKGREGRGGKGKGDDGMKGVSTIHNSRTTKCLSRDFDTGGNGRGGRGGGNKRWKIVYE